MAEGNTGKVYFLSERGRRLQSRAARRRPEPPTVSSTERRKPSIQETTWLARALFIEAMYLTFFWIAVGTDLFTVEPHPEVKQWLYSFFPSELFVAVIALIAGYDLMRQAGRHEVFTPLAAGGLIFLALERLTLLIYSGVLHELTPGERLEITAMGICLSVGVWAVSHSLRQRAER
jgi:hypothetical protein